MSNAEPSATLGQTSAPQKEPSAPKNNKPESKLHHFMHSNMPLVLAAVVLGGGGLAIGYTVGHKQGLTAVGFAADAEQLNEVVQEQKKAINILNTSLNTTVQERDLALTNGKTLTENMRKSTELEQQTEQQRDIYREILRLRGGVALTVQNIDIKPLPENAYEYRLDLMQILPNNHRAAGTVQIRLINSQNVLVVPLTNNRYSFDNTARLTGRWTMPNGFIPEFVEIHLQPNVGQPVVKRYAWQRGAEIENMPTILSEIPQAEANAN